MKSFKFLPHTADVRLRLEASALEELFEAAILGMNNIIKKNGGDKRGGLVEETIKLTSSDLTALLIDFMSEILTLSHEEQAFFSGFKFNKLDANSLAVKIKGHKVSNFDVDIKAVTYHEAEVKKNAKGNWETVVIFDI